VSRVPSLLIFLTILSAFWSTPADADELAPGTPPAASEDARKSARAAFAEGERAFAAGEVPAALAQFERAFELAPHDAVRFNIAVCLEALGRYAEALAQYQTAAESQVLSSAERARAARSAELARSHVGTVSVQGHAGVELLVDGRARCVAPCRVELDPGTHEVVLATRPTERRVTVEIAKGKEVVLTTLPGEASLESRSTERPAPPPQPGAELEPTFAPTWLTWTGTAVAATGVAGIIGFGVWADGLHDDYVREPTQERLDTGTLARDLTNASIGVAALGGVLVAIDLIFLAPGSGPPAARGATRRAPPRLGPSGVVVRF
jgi:hypothetical protein